MALHRHWLPQGENNKDYWNIYIVYYMELLIIIVVVV